MEIDQLKKLVAEYLSAKDNNKPHLMQQVFTADAELRMQVASDNITFPPQVSGEAEITAILVQRFNETYQNIYTFCLPESLPQRTTEHQDHVACRWFVCMQDKQTAEIKVGAGWYRWYPDGERIVRLDIEIEKMHLLSGDEQFEVFAWVQQLPWPWCSAETASETLPFMLEMDALRVFLAE